MDNNLIVSIRLNIWLFYFITYLPDNQSQIVFNSNIFLDRANHLKPYSGIMITTTMSTIPLRTSQRLLCRCVVLL